MKVYITCPVSHTQKRLNLLPDIEKIVKAKGIDSFVFQVDGSPKEIFDRDYNQLKTCDIIIAEVSERSHGVGMEIGMAFCLGLYTILLHEKGTLVTPLALEMPKTKVVEYKDLGDLKNQLSMALDEYKA